MEHLGSARVTLKTAPQRVLTYRLKDQGNKIMGHKLLIATRNPGKIIELNELFSMPGVHIHSFSEFPDVKDIEETGHTFEANAMQKAVYAAVETGLPAIADDSGFQIHGLGGFPGILSARCAGENATDREKVEFVLEKAKELKDRSASFRCVMYYYDSSSGEAAVFTGECKGTLLTEPVGIAKPRLQYDTIFLCDGMDRAFSQISEEEKAAVSHRGIAARKAKEFLEKVFSREG
jgi:XTP/dITP diphosphohydrolase